MVDKMPMRDALHNECDSGTSNELSRIFFGKGMILCIHLVRQLNSNLNRTRSVLDFVAD